MSPTVAMWCFLALKLGRWRGDTVWRAHHIRMPERHTHDKKKSPLLPSTRRTFWTAQAVVAPPRVIVHGRPCRVNAFLRRQPAVVVVDLPNTMAFSLPFPPARCGRRCSPSSNRRCLGAACPEAPRSAPHIGTRPRRLEATVLKTAHDNASGVAVRHGSEATKSQSLAALRLCGG
jgi:hypothetical protein